MFRNYVSQSDWQLQIATIVNSKLHSARKLDTDINFLIQSVKVKKGCKYKN